MNVIVNFVKLSLFYVLGISATLFGLGLFTNNIPFALIYLTAASLFLVFPILFRKNGKVRDLFFWPSIVTSSVVIVLAANFWFKKYQRQYGFSDLKFYLLHVHAAQLVYKKATGTYSNDLSLLELQSFQNQINYFSGLSQRCSANEKFFVGPISPSPAIQKVFSEIDCIDPSMKEKFEIFSVADLGADKLDIWKINQDKQLFHVQDGRMDLNPYSMYDFR